MWDCRLARIWSDFCEKAVCVSGWGSESCCEGGCDTAVVVFTTGTAVAVVVVFVGITGGGGRDVDVPCILLEAPGCATACATSAGSGKEDDIDDALVVTGTNRAT